MEKGNPTDAFWDIEELLPDRPIKKPRKFTSFPDTEAVTIDISPKEKAPNEGGAPIPKKESPKEKPPSQNPKILREYTNDSGFLQKITVAPWPTEFSFYGKFRRDAIRLFDRGHEPCEYVYFFSYMPQYDQMTASQLSYYLYWRGEIRKGAFLKTDINYLFLYTYEILNLPDRIPPAKGAVILSRLWAAYRDDFRYLDKYLGEWLCDYCLVHKVEPDWVTLDVFAGEIASRVSLPEFYLHSGHMTWELMQSVAAYDYKKSKYYPEHKAEFDRHIPRAMEYAAEHQIAPRLSDYGIEPIRILRDSFSGAVACHEVKCKITVICTPLRRSLDLKQTLTGMIKLCENNLRAAFGIKSRFTPSGVSDAVKEEISAYFDTIYPERNLRKKKSAAAIEEERYLALYEPENKGPADISRALAIEEAAWETAALLDLGSDETAEILPPTPDPIPTETPEKPPAEPMATVFPEPEGDFAFLGELDGFLRDALLAASRGEFDAHCRAGGNMAETVRAAINDRAVDCMGDIILEEDFSLIEDYKDEILAALGV